LVNEKNDHFYSDFAKKLDASKKSKFSGCLRLMPQSTLCDENISLR